MKWLSKFNYKTVHVHAYTFDWIDDEADGVSIIFKENGFGKRKVEVVGSAFLIRILKDRVWWHMDVTPWLNHAKGLPKDDTPKPDNVTKLTIVK